MSSSYYLLCLSHDPATTIAGPFNDAEEPLRLAAERAGDCISEHTTCDLLIGRYSGSLIEICCPGDAGPRATHRHPRPRWLDADWLRLLLAVQREPLGNDARARVVKFTVECWFPRRLIRLRRELGVDVPGET